jgi:hypothetical protein
MCNDEIDLSNTVPVENHIARQIGRELTIGLSHDVIDYFRQIGEEAGLPPERIIETCLRQIARAKGNVAIHLPVTDDKPAPAAVGDSL